MRFKRGQVSIFIIIGILILGTIVIFLASRQNPIERQIPASLSPVYSSFLSCMEDYTFEGVNLLESQGGYIYMPSFESGSAYMPFSSQLDFMGSPIPYWYYVSGNNIAKEQVPTVQMMQEDMGKFIDGKIRNCVFDSYYSQGFQIDEGIPKSKVTITEGKIAVSMDMPLNITKTNESVLVTSHNVEVSSNLKKLYDSSVELYQKEQKEMFLENYSVDVMRSYAPVDGVELTCSPLTWNADDVFSNIQNGLEANILALKTKGGDFTLAKAENKYFVINTNINARFLTSRNWTNSFEVNPSRGALLIAEPIGNQNGLGILGFCYVPYHFVYNIKYPVLVQVYENQEFFQFPFAVVVQGNLPRQPANGTFFEAAAMPEICEFNNTFTTVSAVDKRGNPVSAEISYECSGVSCDMGKTSNGILAASFPQCVNGKIVAVAPGFREASTTYSVMNEGETSIFLDKLYDKEVALKIDSNAFSSGQAIINFVSGSETKTVVYPQQKRVNLSEGQYTIQVYIYENSSLSLPASTQKQCVDIPQSGLGSLFGLTEQKCFDYTIPSQIISNALSGGGKENYYILESELEGSNSIEINAYRLPKPTSVEQLQTNYVLFEDKGLGISFK